MFNVSGSANAGVHAQTGFDFQKHSALFLLLESYRQLQGKQYFICLEHHEDVLFCYLNNDRVESIHAYQAKKASASWGCTQELFEIIKKMTENGLRLRNDPIDKTGNYSHKLHFATNHDIRLLVKQKKPLKNATCTVNDSNCLVEYSNLDTALQGLFKAELSKLTSDFSQIAELNHVSLRYIDLAKQSNSQREQLIGAFNTVFGTTVRDPAAAVDILLSLFKKIETTFNQSGVARLADNSKRVNSEEIDSVVNVITTKQKAYDLWREEKQNISGKFNISLLDRTRFELDFDNSFDLFKDLRQVEHQKIKSFVRLNKLLLGKHTNDVDCLEEMLNKFDMEESSSLNESQKKAALYAAYVEIKG